jgi:DNA/RNA endonuclease YhcR with UshA esterase domain
MAKSDWFEENKWVIISCIVIGALVLWWIIASMPQQVSTLSISDSACYSAEQARDHKNEDGCVNFHVGYAYESSAGNKFIDQYEDYTTGFIVYIPSGSSASKLNLDQFNGKDIRVSGKVVDYGGATEIIVDDISQIKIYE